MALYHSQMQRDMINREYYVSVLPGKALRTLVDIEWFAERFNMRSQNRAWLTWYQKTQTWYSIYQFTHYFTLQTSDYDVIFDVCVDLASLATSFKKCNVIMTW